MDNFEQSAVQPPRTPPMDALSGTLIYSLSLESPGSLGGRPDRPEDIVVAPGLQSSRGTTGSSWMALESGGLFAPR